VGNYACVKKLGISEYFVFKGVFLANHLASTANLTRTVKRHYLLQWRLAGCDLQWFFAGSETARKTTDSQRYN